jgi:TonB family protein
MRNLIMASLVLSSLALSAQAATNAPVLQAKFNQPMLIAAAADRTPVVPKVRVSTGVIAPKLISTVAIKEESNSAWKLSGLDRRVVVALVVDATGKPTDLKIVKSAGAELDKNVLEAVAQYRYAPGTVSKQPTAVPVNLEINIQGR